MMRKRPAQKKEESSSGDSSASCSASDDCHSSFSSIESGSTDDDDRSERLSYSSSSQNEEKSSSNLPKPPSIKKNARKIPPPPPPPQRPNKKENQNNVAKNNKTPSKTTTGLKQSLFGNRRKKNHSSKSSSRRPSSSLSEKSSKSSDSLSHLESQHDGRQFETKIITSEHSYDMNSSLQESFPGGSNKSNSSNDDYEEVDSSSSSGRDGSDDEGSDHDLSRNSKNMSRNKRKRRKRRGRNERMEETMRSLSLRASSMVDQIKRPDHLFILMAIGIFIVCALAVYFFGIRDWIETESNGLNGDLFDTMPSAMPTSNPSNAELNNVEEKSSSRPSFIPTSYPTILTKNSKHKRTSTPSQGRSQPPSVNPTNNPSQFPSRRLTLLPSIDKSIKPTLLPSVAPIKQISPNPTMMESNTPSISMVPTGTLSLAPTQSPSGSPSLSNIPTISQVPSADPTEKSCTCTPRVYNWKLNFTKGCPLVISNSKGIKDTSLCLYDYDSDQDRKENEFTPVVITEVAIQELSPEFEVVKEFSSDDVLQEGDKLQFESITTEGQISGGLRGQLKALNSPGEFTLHFGVKFSNICEEQPFQVGDSIGFLEFEEDLEPAIGMCFYTTNEPSQSPTKSSIPSTFPSSKPTSTISSPPTSFFSQNPTSIPSEDPSMNPSSKPTLKPSSSPSLLPSLNPSKLLSQEPTASPSTSPSVKPSLLPSKQPTGNPSSSPSIAYAWETFAPTIYGLDSEIFLGESVAMSGDGNTIAVGQDSESQVRVYDLINGAWSQRGITLEGAPFSGFGYTVSISNDGMIVAIGGSRYMNFKGIVEVWSWNGVFWIQYGKDLNGQEDNDQFGVGLDLSSDGNHLIVGSKDKNSNNSKGSVRVFQYNGEDWVQQGATIFGDDENDEFGGDIGTVSITSDGKHIAVGCPWSREMKSFSWDGVQWIQMGSTIHRGGSINFGQSVVLTSPSSGNFTVAVGSPKEEPRGSIRVYDFDGSNWIERQDFIRIDRFQSLGFQLSMTNDAKTILTSTSFTVLVFVWDGNYWIQRGNDILYVDGDPEGKETSSFKTIDFSNDGNKVVVGVPNDFDGLFHGQNYGQVRSFEWRREEN